MSMRLSKGLTVAAAVTGLLLAGCSSGSSGESSSTVAADCTPANVFTTIKDGTLTIAAPEFPPFSSLAGGTAAGVDVDIITAIAEMECLTPEYVQVDYSGAVPAVQSGRTDVAIGDYYRTTSRAEVVGLSEAMYVDGMGIISKDGVTDIPTILTRNVGTVDGYLWVADLQAQLGGKLKIYKSNVEMWADLDSGRIDVGIDSVPAAAFSASQNGGDWKVTTADPYEPIGASVKPAQVGIPFTKSNTALGEALNADIAALRADGTLKQIFIDHDVDPSLTEVEDSYLLDS